MNSLLLLFVELNIVNKLSNANQVDLNCFMYFSFQFQISYLLRIAFPTRTKGIFFSKRDLGEIDNFSGIRELFIKTNLRRRWLNVSYFSWLLWIWLCNCCNFYSEKNKIFMHFKSQCNSVQMTKTTSLLNRSLLGIWFIAIWIFDLSRFLQLIVDCAINQENYQDLHSFGMLKKLP